MNGISHIRVELFDREDGEQLFEINLNDQGKTVRLARGWIDEDGQTQIGGEDATINEELVYLLVEAALNGEI